MDWKKIGKKLFFLPTWGIVLLSLVSAFALACVFVEGLEFLWISYVVYVLAFYALTVLCLGLWKTIPDCYREMKKKVYKNEYARKYFTNTLYKTHMNLYGSFAVNLIYVIVNAISSVLYHTVWFAIFSVYYGIMAILRFLLAHYMRRNSIGENRLRELKRSRLCAQILVTVNLILSGVVLMMVYFNRSFQYQGYLIYVMALYTFYITTTAVIDLVRYRKYNSPVMTITKIIKLTASLFSMLFLETAMFAQFGGDSSREFQRIMIMATGAGISIIVVIMSIYMIVRTSKEIKEIKRSQLEYGKSGI